MQIKCPTRPFELNCAASDRYSGLSLRSVSWVPCATRRPPSSTRIRSASRTVESRCAMTEGGAARVQSTQRIDHQALRERVEGGGRLIENQYGRVLQERPRHAEALPLAAGNASPGIAKFRVVAIRQRRNEFVRVRRARRALDLCVSGVEIPVTQVRSDAAREDDCLLQKQWRSVRAGRAADSVARRRRR